ncbi:DUF2855 family protein [Leptospira sp. GIMC2001]|uniref:DUF2855 family protein n=1 Tax=Leptospira sp. GIMC2001 TaxID=1513297 RepID=UPI002349F8D3|nr:DUF2855 family protein [Leptospira sp. GIMC2001]WCL49699.1 DUF2855 family protein [Leptospira sp. GIMC2001]
MAIGIQVNQFVVNKKNIKEYKFISETISSQAAISEGQVLLEIEKLSFTANNITYANLGDSFGYWNFFPLVNLPEFGIIPAWGFATVIESNNTEIKIGERFYGYYPTASHLVVEPGKVRETGFSDAAAHRSKLSGIYNYYTNLRSDYLYKSNSEDFQLTFRPLFSTAFLLEDFLRENGFFGSDQIIITGASSKTALALTQLIQTNKTNLHPIEIIALTSKNNKNFIHQLGCYSHIFEYKEITEIRSENSLIVDFAGNHNFIAQLQEHLIEKLKYTSLVGALQWDDRNLNPRNGTGVLFFAPEQMRKKSREWGMVNFQERFSISWNEFFQGTKDWFEFRTLMDPEAFANFYLQCINGRVEPKTATLVDFRRINIS